MSSIPTRRSSSPFSWDDASFFWQHVQVLSPDECWLWQGRATDSGHGVFDGGRRKSPAGNGLPDRAHRRAWELTFGDIPPGLCVCHGCPTGDNPLCCNPRHLFLGTASENIKDMWRKGRAKAGGRVPMTLEEREDIRARYAGGASMRSIEAAVGWSRRTVWEAVAGMCPEKRRASKLTPESAASIRQRLADGERVGALAREYNVTSSTISHVKYGKVFKDRSHQ